MLGSSLFKNLSSNFGLDVYGTLRSVDKYKFFFSQTEYSKLYEYDALKSFEEINKIICDAKPDVVINCIGKIPQKDSTQPDILELNSLFPHKILTFCEEFKARMIHFSTDCVFSGKEGNYNETDITDAEDLYGQSKIKGEINSHKHLTIRTSIIGHEIETQNSLLEWFLSQTDDISGYSKAIFSGFPCNYHAKILAEHILPSLSVNGLIHIGSIPISKFKLLQIIKKVYDKSINIHKNDKYIIDKSLDSKRFKQITGFESPKWEFLVEYMNQDFKSYYEVNRK